MNHMRYYKTVTKLQLAQAYGFKREVSIITRIREKIGKLSEEQLTTLGRWTGNGNLIPDQTKVLVELLGTPSEPHLVYTEKPLQAL